MRHTIYLMVSLILGLSLTYLFYLVGGIWVRPALFMAALFFKDSGGESLLLPYLVLNTVTCALLIYALLLFIERSGRSAMQKGGNQLTNESAIDHLILNVNDIQSSVDFYVNVMGFQNDGQEGPFTVIRVNDGFVLLLGPWGTKGGEHLAFALSRSAFDETFARMKDQGIPYGDSFHSVGNNLGPGNENGARGSGPTVYLNDPNMHVIEIRTYE